MNEKIQRLAEILRTSDNIVFLVEQESVLQAIFQISEAPLDYTVRS